MTKDTPAGRNADDQRPAGRDHPVRILRAGAERVDELEVLWHELAKHVNATGPSIGPPLAREESWRRVRTAHGAILDRGDSFLLVAERNGRPVGYALVAIEAQRSLKQAVPERRALLSYVSVLPAERGRGVGTALVRATKFELRALGIYRLSLDVHVGNEDAVRFYRRHGFEVEVLEMSVAL